MLREYQKECLRTIEEEGEGKFLIQMATGLGKGHILPHINYENDTKVLIVAHRSELVEQNIERFSEEMQKKVISMSIQTLMKRYNQYNKFAFSTIILDEAHRYANNRWKEVIEYFNPKRLIGFTATPARTDGAKLPFDKLIYSKSLIWGIKNKFLCDIKAERVEVGYDISDVAKSMGDFNNKQLEKAVNIESANKAIRKIFEKAEKPVLIFAVNIEHAEALATECEIPSITQKTKPKDRKKFTEDCRAGKIDGIVSVNVFTEGVNINNAKSLILARPTSSELLYIQMVGRILRLSPGKDKAYLYDCVGCTERLDLCGAYTLLGLDINIVKSDRISEIYGDLLEMEDMLEEVMNDSPETWIKNRKNVNLFARKNKLNTRGVNFILHPNGTMIVGIGKNKWIGMEKLNHLKETYIISNRKNFKKGPYKAQEAIDKILEYLNKFASEQSTLWDYRAVARWGKAPATEKQINYAKRLLKGKGKKVNLNIMTKEELATIISYAKMYN